MSDQVFTHRPFTRDEIQAYIEDPGMFDYDVQRLAIALKLRIHQIDRLQFALHKCDRWHNVLEDLIEDAYLDTYDMEEIP